MRLLSFLLCQILFVGSYAQNIVIEKEHLLSAEIPFPLVESHMVVNPVNQKHLLVAAITIKEPEKDNNSESYITLFQSYDGGLSWTYKQFNDDVTLGADPWIAINNKGVVVLTVLTASKITPQVCLLAYVSPDAGKTWGGNPFNLGTNHDREAVIVDPKTQNFIIVSNKIKRVEGAVRSGIFCAKLSPSGLFIESNWIPFSNVDITSTHPVYSTEGYLFIPFVDYSFNNQPLKTRRYWLVKSKNSGNNFSEPLLMTETQSVFFSPNLLIDTSNHKNKLYLIKPDGITTNYNKISIISSDNMGETWSSPIRIDHSNDSIIMRNVNATVNKKGVVAVFWYDTRNDPANKNQDIYFTASLDGGKTFLKEQRVTTKSSFTQTIKNGWSAKRWPSGGDYSGIVAMEDGSFQIVWSDARSGIYQLYTSNIKIVE